MESTSTSRRRGITTKCGNRREDRGDGGEGRCVDVDIDITSTRCRDEEE